MQEELPMAERYDVAIIGGGPGGYVAGIRAGQLGLRAVVIEREPQLGGVCLNWGCIPTKALIKNAEMVNFLHDRADEFGITVHDPAISWDKAVGRSRKVVDRMTRGVAGLLKKNNVNVVTGTARFSGAHTLAVEPAGDGPATTVEADHVIIATGSRSRLLPGLVADGQRVLTSRHAVGLESVPAHFLVMGAGPIGMEFAYVYRAYGARVTVVEMLDRVLPLEDAEASAVVHKAFERQGVDVRVGTKVEQVAVSESGVQLTVAKDGQSEVLAGDQVLVAIGRAPNVDGLGLAEAGIALSEKGFIQVGADLRTSLPHVFAIGDVAGPPMLAHKASHEGVQVAEAIAGRPTHAVDAWLIPSCTYCQPQVASIGRTEEQARAAGFAVKVSKFPFGGIGKAVAIGETGGWVKIVADARYGEILGATIVGPEATELIHELVLARSAELTADELVRTVHAHPTLSEAIHEAALGVDGLPLHV
jgi:dihydrolipoamide dehydrogenase